MASVFLISSSLQERLCTEASVVPLGGKIKGQLILKKASAFLGLAIVSIFIPVLHFVLVPAFMIASLWIAKKTASFRFLLGAFEVPCLRCEKRISIKQQGIEFEIRDFCSHCGEQFKIVVRGDA